ncbi:hypothetical protein OIV83_004413 [Microbotryomycetes sp. JL201]|nr:hypothetical protein OIV83_004413 [Microbotryomycetes sp. JL201]
MAFTDGVVISWLCRILLLTGMTVPACEALPGATPLARVTTTKGEIQGRQAGRVRRFAVPYAQPPLGSLRFKDPSPIGSLANYDASGLPPACPQPLPVATSEDCLYMTVYTPDNATSRSNLPVLVWLHGGSFYYGSTTAYGIDGSDLVKRENVVVVTVQYRLGALGFAKSAALGLTGNYGVKDVIAALQFMQSDIRAFGGDPSKVTLAGQSSGAELVNTLLATPSASNLFHRAILQSAPLDFTDQSSETASEVGKMFTSQLQCLTQECLTRAPVEAVLGAQASVMGVGANGGLPGIPMLDSVFRPVVDGTLVTHTVRDGAARSTDKAVLMTTMRDEAAQHLAYYFPSPQPQYMFEPLVSTFFPSRVRSIVTSGLYDPATKFSGNDRVRDAFTRIATDYMWTCSNQRLALDMATQGQQVYLGQFDLGISYSNKTVAYTADKPVHEDDLLTLFRPAGLAMTRQQQAVADEVQKRWTSFMKTGSPNRPGLVQWNPVVADNHLNLLVLGAASSGRSRIDSSQRLEVCAINGGVYTYA